MSRRRWGDLDSRRLRSLAAALCLLLASCSSSGGEDDPSGPARLAPPPWPEWVHRHWVWEGESTQESALALVRDYLDRGIPVGAIIIDSPWETAYNTFAWDPSLFPDPAGMIDDIHALGARVFLWITSMINDDSPTYDAAKARGYLLSGGRTVSWWKGDGALLDYSNPAALEWWHSQMDPVLDLEIDGWKCDGVDPFVLLLLDPTGLAGRIGWREYAALYYGDFFHYTRERLGRDRVITARPSDSYFGLQVGVPFAPVEVNFAGWVGDQDSTFQGLRAALANMFASARLGYVSFGSDIGGYRGDGLRDPELFVRWAQLGALSGVMENGGGGEHRPWMYGEEVEAIYRKFTVLHHEIVPYLYGSAAASYEAGLSLVRIQEGIWTYLLGEDILVAAMTEPGTARLVRFPSGTWIDFLDEGRSYEGGGTRVVGVPLDRYPVFVRKGAIVPLDVADGTAGHGTVACAGHLTVAVYPDGPGSAGTFDLHEEKGGGIAISYERGETSLGLRATATQRPLLFRVVGEGRPERVSTESGKEVGEVSSLDALGSVPLAWTYSDGIAWVRVAEPGRGVRVGLSYR